MAQQTQVIASQCGSTLPQLNSQIFANLVAGASAYKFRVTANGSSHEVVRSLRVFRLTDLPQFQFAQTYTVEVAARIGTEFGAFGPACEITSPSPQTQVVNAQCGTILSAMNQPVTANLVSFATGYRFRLTNVINPAEVFTIDRTLREFRMNETPASTSTTYMVEVAVRNHDGSYLPYGPACDVTTPIISTTLEDAYCGKYLGSLSEQIYAKLVPMVTGYRFKVVDMQNSAVQGTVDKVLRVFSMSEIDIVQYSKSYLVSVAVRDQNGQYLPFGTPCVVHTPAMPMPKIQLSQCDLTASSWTQTISADAIPNATAYRFRMQSNTGDYSVWIDSPTRSFVLNTFAGLQGNTEYTIRVAAKVGGVYSPYGKACNVVTPPLVASRLAPENAGREENFVYPNPFSSDFSIHLADAGSMYNLMICDGSGRQMENKQVAAENLRTEAFGSHLPAGFYVVTLANDHIKYHFKINKI